MTATRFPRPRMPCRGTSAWHGAQSAATRRRHPRPPANRPAALVVVGTTCSPQLVVHALRYRLHLYLHHDDIFITQNSGPHPYPTRSGHPNTACSPAARTAPAAAAARCPRSPPPPAPPRASPRAAARRSAVRRTSCRPAAPAGACGTLRTRGKVGAQSSVERDTDDEACKGWKLCRTAVRLTATCVGCGPGPYMATKRGWSDFCTVRMSGGLTEVLQRSTHASVLFDGLLTWLCCLYGIEASLTPFYSMTHRKQRSSQTAQTARAGPLQAGNCAERMGLSVLACSNARGPQHTLRPCAGHKQ